jgi:hypothetical protein
MSFYQARKYQYKWKFENVLTIQRLHWGSCRFLEDFAHQSFLTSTGPFTGSVIVVKCALRLYLFVTWDNNTYIQKSCKITDNAYKRCDRKSGA